MKKQVEVKMGPFATFNDRKIAIATQKYIVPWSIALFGYSLTKLQTIDTYREMLIAVIDAEQLLPGHPDCAKEARAYPVAFADLLKKIKHAAGMYCFVMRTYCCCSYPWPDCLSLADRAVGRHRIEMREALIKLLEEPIPESYKAGRKVMEAVLGRPLSDKPVLCFSSNPVLAALVKPGKTPCVWETKARVDLGYESVVKTTDTAGQELLMDFIGKMVHTLFVLGTNLVHTEYIFAHTQYKLSTYRVHTSSFWYKLSTY